MDFQAPLKIITHDQLCVEKVPDPCGAVIFGASGDLTRRKLIPALYSLFRAKLLPKGFFILGIARTEGTDESFRDRVKEVLLEKFPEEKEKILDFSGRAYYLSGGYTEEETFRGLARALRELHKKHESAGNTIFYLATPPNLYCGVITELGKAGLVRPVRKDEPWTRVVIEKPFGHDLDSAVGLNRKIHEVLDESQVYRIDHYLGKETVQNILMFRFANNIFEPVWNQGHIDHVQITAAESLGVGHRAGYYDQAGVLRDMFQNHMLQLLSLIAMEPPIEFEAQQYRDEKLKITRSLRPIPKGKLNDFVVRGQYGPGVSGGEKVPGYRQEKGVPPDSQTETYTAMKLFIDNWRWEGVPFYLRSGKRLERSATEIAIQFKNVPHSMFAPLKADQFQPNVLSFRIQPDEGISLRFEAKHPGPKLCMATLRLEFNYKDAFREEPMEAYERLLLDCMQGDQMLFVRQDVVERSWEFITRIHKEWDGAPPPAFPNYAAGSWGPEEAAQILRKEGRRWRS